MIHSRWIVGWPSLETEQSHHISCLEVLLTLISKPRVKTGPYSALCFVSLCQFPHLSSFSLLPPPHHRHRRCLSLLGSEKECTRAGGDLTQQAPWLWLRRAIYKWLLINPRPTLMLSHIFSFPSHAHFCMLSDVRPADMCLQLSASSCNLVWFAKQLRTFGFFKFRSIKTGFF